MPNRPRRTAGAAESPLLSVLKELRDELVKGPMTQHLGYQQGDANPGGQSNPRNGGSSKTVLTNVPE